MKKVARCTCNEINCPDYYYCWYESVHGRLTRCEKRELEIEEEMANEDSLRGRKSDNQFWVR